MSEPIRLLHFADLHVGMENYGKLDPQTGISSRIRDFLDRLDEIVDFALGHEADLVIFAGDAFKTRDLVIQKSALSDSNWDYVALGHIHKHQNLTPAHPRGAPAEGAAGTPPPIVYSGSLERIDFGEEVEDKGFCWVKLARSATQWEFRRVRARPFRSINVDVREEDDPTAAAVAAIQARGIEGAVVRVNIAAREGQEAALRRRELEAALAPA